jgi:hypothetical protein
LQNIPHFVVCGGFVRKLKLPNESDMQKSADKGLPDAKGNLGAAWFVLWE